MATSSAPIRIDNDLYEAAKVAAATQDRSAAQQIAHWARLGRAVEESANVSAAAIRALLEGHRHYDRLTTEEQAVARVAWPERLDALAGGIDLTEVLQRKGYTEAIGADAEGHPVRRELGAR